MVSHMGSQLGTVSLDTSTLKLFALGPELTFVRRIARMTGSRLLITLPPEVSELVEPGRKYKVTLSAVGSIEG